jgi:predicted GH43/DUF377 family glycosyl hydrolase
MSEFKLKRMGGPILKPIAEHNWESGAVFNPGVVREDDIVHILYRAVEGENFSTIGYARLDLSGKVLERRNKPVILRELNIERHGCEDPRIVRLNDRYLIFYSAFDGQFPEKSENVRVVMAKTNDFKNYKKMGMVGPDTQDKDAMIFPEIIEGRIAYLHRVVPNIQLAMFDDLEHFIKPEPSYWQNHLKDLEKYTVMCRQFEWEAKKIGVGPPPLKTDAGWLLIYHGVDKDHVYRAGAALLDEKNPFKVIARLPYPILEPETEYEKYGDVDMVVFPEGLVQLNDDLQIYYGAADKVIGLATGSLSLLIEELWKNRVS